MSFVVDTNILIYHAAGSAIAHEFLASLIAAGTFNISIITKIEFLGWHAQTPEGFKKCGRLVGLSSVLAVKRLRIRQSPSGEIRMSDWQMPS